MDSTGRKYQERGLRDAVLAGDERAWRELYDQSFEPLYRYVHWRCGGDHEWAEEIAQETWMTAVKRISCFDPDLGTFLDWLRGIATNVLRNGYRRRGRHPRPTNSIDQDIPDGKMGHDQSARGEMVAEILLTLTDRHEKVLRAKYLDGLSIFEIASEWRESSKAIESLLTRARAAFREAFEKWDNDHERTR